VFGSPGTCMDPPSPIRHACLSPVKRLSLAGFWGRGNLRTRFSNRKQTPNTNHGNPRHDQEGTMLFCLYLGSTRKAISTEHPQG
jgi:hypothetical protein